MLAATLFGISLGNWAVLAFTVFLSGVFGLGILIGQSIKAGREGGYPIHPVEETPQPLDLDDWLAQEGELFEFKVWKRPEAEAQFEQRAA